MIYLTAVNVIISRMGKKVMIESKLIEILDRFKGMIGESHVLSEPSELASYGDWTHLPSRPSAIVFPASTEEVSAILAYCSQNHIKVVPSGGRTGLAGGAVATDGEVILSLSRMNRIGVIDPIGLSVELEAGVITQHLQEVASEAGLFFPIDLAAKGSSQIGGNIATNAGGLKFIRYGSMRDQVLGLEVVLSSGQVLDMNYSLAKNNTGYDLKQLFIGSEGTLGIITRATLKLAPKPKGFRLALIGVNHFDDIPRLLEEANKHQLPVSAFEFFTGEALSIVLKQYQQIHPPLETEAPFLALVEIEAQESEECHFDVYLERVFEKNLAVDGMLASSSQEFDRIWSLRENISESLQSYGYLHKNDISLPIKELSQFMRYLEEIKISADPVTLVSFGHVGDGNIHLNYAAKKEDIGAEEFHSKVKYIEEKVFLLIQKFRGSISAEHGIGLLKREDLTYTRSELEVQYMRQIKNIFDKNFILNPGKIFTEKMI